MSRGKISLRWVVVALAVTAVAAVACSTGETVEKIVVQTVIVEKLVPGEKVIETVIVEKRVVETVIVEKVVVVTATPVPAAAEAPKTATENYAAAVRAIREQSNAREEELLGPVRNAPPNMRELLTALAKAIPPAIEGVRSEIASLEALSPPEQYETDHENLITFLRDQTDLRRRLLEASIAGEELRAQELFVQLSTLERNLASGLSEPFRELVFVSEAAREAGEVFGGMSAAESAYLDTITAGFQEFAKRAAVFGQRLQRQFSDARAVLEALQGAGAGTAFEAVQTVIKAAQPPPRFESDHKLLLESLEESVRLDREIGKAIEDLDPVHFVVSNFELGNSEPFVRAKLGVSQQVREIAFPQDAYAFRPPGPDVLDGGYRERLYTIVREFSARFGRTGPDYLLFNLGPDDAFEVVSRASPRFTAAVENAMGKVTALTPPDELRVDHNRLVAYFKDTLAAQRQIARAAAAAERDGIRDGIARTREVFCKTARGFSDAMKPVVFVNFGGPPPDRDLTRECGPLPG